MRYEVVAETGSTSVPETGEPLRYEVAHRCGHEHKTWEAAVRCYRTLRNGGRSARWYNATIHYAHEGIRVSEDDRGDTLAEVLANRALDSLPSAAEFAEMAAWERKADEDDALEEEEVP